MSLTANSQLKSARRKFFMNSTYIMSRKQQSKFFGSGGRNESKWHQLARIGDWKIFHELDVHHVQKVGIKRFWAQEAKMSLKAMCWLKSARRKLFMNSTYIRCRKSNVFVSGGQNESNSHQLAGIAEKKISKSTYIRCRKQESNVFGLREAEMSLTTNQLSRNRREENFHELDVHHVQKVGIKRFWAQEAEMSLTAISSLESVR